MTARIINDKVHQGVSRRSKCRSTGRTTGKQSYSRVVFESDRAKAFVKISEAFGDFSIVDELQGTSWVRDAACSQLSIARVDEVELLVRVKGGRLWKWKGECRYVLGIFAMHYLRRGPYCHQTSAKIHI